MTDTEQKAIEMVREDLKKAYNKKTLFVETTYNALDIALNLIQKQDTEINKLRQQNEQLKIDLGYTRKVVKYTGDHIPRID